MRSGARRPRVPRELGKDGLEVWTTDRTPEVVAFLEARGYEEVRRYVISELDVAAAPDPDPPPFPWSRSRSGPTSRRRSTSSRRSRIRTSRGGRAQSSASGAPRRRGG